jgi:hypothetical protein
MEIELCGTVRGEEVTVRWRDGELTGSEELLARLAPLLGDGRCDPGDLTSVIRSVELIAGQRMKLRVIDERVARPGRAGPVSSAA